jgi:TATA-box binding protein (TBP) (component of TFIID and TFIIIB)
MALDAADIDDFFRQLEAEDAREQQKNTEALQFMRHLSTVQLSERELAALGGGGMMDAEVDEAAQIEEYIARHEARNRPRLVQLRDEDRITEEERRKELIKIVNTVSGVELTMMPENMVYVTYFRDKYSKRRCLFSLPALASALAPYGVEFSTSKFAKITLRHLYGPSHLFFGSGALLETGTYNAVIARKSLNHTIQLLELAGYCNIEVGRRKCQNIVAKGTLDFELCLLVLRDKYPDCVTYKCKEFVGAIIRLKKKKGPASALTLGQQLTSDGGGAMDETAAGADSEESSDEDDDEYECLEVHDSDLLYNSGFAYYEAPEAQDRQELDEDEMAALDAIVQAGSAPGADPASSDGLVGVRKADEMDERDLAQVKKKNVTIIVFAKGRIICAGCKTSRGAKLACARVLPMLEACRKTKQNSELEHRLERKEKFIQVNQLLEELMKKC